MATKKEKDSNILIKTTVKNQLKEYCARHDLRINSVVSELVTKFLKKVSGGDNGNPKA